MVFSSAKQATPILGPIVQSVNVKLHPSPGTFEKKKDPSVLDYCTPFQTSGTKHMAAFENTIVNCFEDSANVCFMIG